MFGDLDWPLNTSRRFVSISWACLVSLCHLRRLIIIIAAVFCLTFYDVFSRTCILLRHCSGHAQLCNSCMHGVQLAPVRRTWMACLLGSVNVQRACTTCDPCKHCIKFTTWTQSKQILTSQSACISFYPHNEKCQTQTNCTCTVLLSWGASSYSTGAAGRRPLLAADDVVVWAARLLSAAAAAAAASSSEPSVISESLSRWRYTQHTVTVNIIFTTSLQHHECTIFLFQTYAECFSMNESFSITNENKI